MQAPQRYFVQPTRGMQQYPGGAVRGLLFLLSRTPLNLHHFCATPKIEEMVLPVIEPMKLSRIAAPFDNPGFVFELKYDGFR